MASISDYSSNFAAGASGLTIGLPANTSGQLLVLLVSMNATTNPPTISTPSGWTAASAGVSSASSVDSAIFYKVGDGSTLETVSATGATVWLGAVALVIDDVNLASIPDGSDKDGTGNATTHNAAATGFTTTVANDLIIGFWGFAYTTSITITPPTGMSTYVQVDSGSGGLNPQTLFIATYVQSAAGATGTKAAHSSGAFSANLLFAIKSYLGPTRSYVSYPNGGESLTAGSSVTLTCTAASSPTALASTLQYEFSYSSDYGLSWTTIGLSSAGVLSKAWTVPAGPISSGWYVRVRAKDPASGLFSQAYDSSDSSFSVVAEVAPNAPTSLSPNTNYPALNKAAMQTLSWVHGGGSGNPQTAYTLQWSRDGFASHTATVGPTSTATQSTSIDFSAEAVGTTITWHVKTTGLSLTSAYSNNAAFVVASLPTTPNITAPTNASPPSVPNPTVTHTITAGETQAQRRIRIVQSGAEVYSSGFESTSLLSAVLAYALSNGVAVSLKLAIRNQYGLESAEDTETFTPAYTGPSVPTLAVTNIDSGGYNLIQITNSDTVLYNEIWRYPSSASVASAIKVGAALANDASFQDFNVASGIAYKYFARAYNAGGYTDSTVSSAVTLTLSNAYLHAISRTSTNGNATGSVVSLLNTTPQQLTVLEDSASHQLLGRSDPVAVFGQAYWQTMNITATVLVATDLANILAVFNLGSTVCLRDQMGNRIIGTMTQPQIVPDALIYHVTFTVTESLYSEGL